MDAPARRRPRNAPWLPSAALALAVLLTAGAGRASAQSPVDSLRAEMEASILRLSQVDQGMLRATMQAPDFEKHIGYLQVMIASVQLDLDYLEALLQMSVLARDPRAASAIVRREMDGVRDRMMLDELEDEVRVRRETGDYAPPLLQMIERDMIAEMHRVLEHFRRAEEILPPPGG